MSKLEMCVDIHETKAISFNFVLSTRAAINEAKAISFDFVLSTRAAIRERKLGGANAASVKETTDEYEAKASPRYPRKLETSITKTRLLRLTSHQLNKKTSPPR
ncbi:hypothetical protein CERZMDRAFT_101826 [Cercospora zeae-maydis SCOH1-5]|uniref:Uncharacterized protein n=1 Tax=Cercospora zeae-maydis SCOH1-5 TaxID=717836 RepID=A0A6A6F2F0_9PEZI|nr:hypothetical protein CERZMDRAFT_101826 [Cercospora zeae-maydis SCOH1-5]